MHVGFVVGLQVLIICSPSSAQVASADGPPAGTVTSKLIRYAQRVVRQHDTNGDSRLDDQEWNSMGGRPESADLNGDGQITVDEFARYAASYGAGRRIRLSTPRDPIAETNRAGPRPGASTTEAANTAPVAPDQRRDLKYFAPLPVGVPGWFVERDTDGDAQLTLAEFSPKLRTMEVAEFKGYDVNGDGLLTAAEMARAAGEPRSEGTGTSEAVAPPRP